MHRTQQITLIASLLAFSWLAMQAVHEFGHVCGAWMTGGQVSRVTLHPATISHTELAENPWPMVVVWAGPVLGSLLPLAAFLLARACRVRGVYLLRFFAGFCLVVNGAYIAFGPADSLTDTGVMLALESPRWAPMLFGLLTIPPGIFLWHRQGRHFGLGDAQGKVDGRATIVAVCLLAGIVVLELLFGGVANAGHEWPG